MGDQPSLTALSEAVREQALQRFRIVQPYLDGQRSLAAIAQEQALTSRTLQRWVARYQSEGLAGLRSARARGRKGGRKREMTHAKALQAVAMIKDNSTSVAQICETLGISYSTLYRHVSSEGQLRGPYAE